MELLFALELLFIIRPGAPDHGAAGAPLLVLLIIRLLFIIRPGAAVYNSPTRGSGVLENALLLVCAAGYLLVISACPRAAV